MKVRVFLYAVDGFGPRRLPGGWGFESGQPHRDGLRAVAALRPALPPLVFADFRVTKAK